MWKSPKRLVELGTFYEELRNNPHLYTDEDIVSRIEESFWGTNCWCFVEASLSIIAPACLLRPELTVRLIRYPIDAMIAGGLTDYKEVIQQGLALAEKNDPYVEPTEEGKYWLKNIWPDLHLEIKKVFDEIWHECTRER